MNEYQKEMFEHLRLMVNYWLDQPDQTMKVFNDDPQRARMESLVFSFLTMLDGCAHPSGYYMIPLEMELTDEQREIVDKLDVAGGYLHEIYNNDDEEVES